MSDLVHILVYAIQGERHGLPLSVVERVTPAVEITPLTEVPETVVGIINVQGKIIPVISMRSKFQLPPRPIHLTDRIIIITTLKGRLALLVDAVHDVFELPQTRIVSEDQGLPSTRVLSSLIKLDDGLVLVYDPDQLFAVEQGVLHHAVASVA